MKLGIYNYSLFQNNREKGYQNKVVGRVKVSWVINKRGLVRVRIKMGLLKSLEVGTSYPVLMKQKIQIKEKKGKRIGYARSLINVRG